MKARAAVREVLMRRDLKIHRVAQRLGKKDSYITDKLSQVRATDNMGLETFCAILNAADYKVVAMPREVRTPVDGIELE